jgi:hypothetical protein
MSETEVFEGSTETKAGGAYYDHISGETKTEWKPSEIVIYPWMEIKPILKLSLNDYEGKKGVIKWIADELTVCEKRSGTGLNGLIKRYTQIYSTCTAIQKDYKILHQVGRFDFQFPFGKLKEYINSICDDSLSKDDKIEIIVGVMDDIVAVLNKYMYGIGVEEGIDYKTPQQWLEERKKKVVKKIICPLCGGKHLNDDKGMRQHEKTVKHQTAVEAQQKNTVIKKVRTSETNEPCEICGKMIKGDATKLTKHQKTQACRASNTLSPKEIRELLSKKNVSLIDKYVDDIGEDGDSETYDALNEAFDEIQNEILEESEPEVETEPEEVIENVIIDSQSSDKIEIEVEEVEEYDEDQSHLPEHLRSSCPSGAWMWSCGDSKFKDAEIQDESIYGDWAPRVDSPVLNSRITLDVREAISV